jgi:hypothetical protein
MQDKYSNFVLAFIPDIHARLRRHLKQSQAESTKGHGAVQKRAVECPLRVVNERSNENVDAY